MYLIVPVWFLLNTCPQIAHGFGDEGPFSSESGLVICRPSYCLKLSWYTCFFWDRNAHNGWNNSREVSFPWHDFHWCIKYQSRHHFYMDGAHVLCGWLQCKNISRSLEIPPSFMNQSEPKEFKSAGICCVFLMFVLFSSHAFSPRRNKNHLLHQCQV